MGKIIRNVSVIGTGTLGTQIALMAVHYGCRVKIYDPDKTSFAKALDRIQIRVKNSGRETLPPFVDLSGGAAKVQICGDLGEALEQGELVIEAAPEDLALKRKVFKEIDCQAPREAILATNSSSIPVSRIESATTRPEKCLNIHFYSPDLGRNIVDIMGGTKTTDETMEAGKGWIQAIGCIPLTVKKESVGFCFNRVWRAIKRECLHMWADGTVDFKDIDRWWIAKKDRKYN